MSRIRPSQYSFLLVSIISLIVGLVLDYSNTGFQNYAWAVGASIGLVLAINWVVIAIKDRQFGSDSLAVIAILATGLTNEWLAASVISVMLATGRALEKWAEGRARRQLEALLERAPRTANRIDSDGNIETIPVDQVSVGDTIMVRSGEVVPIDGELTTPGSFDESALTGEPIPQSLEPGDEIESGSLNASGSVELRAVRIASQSTYANLIRLVKSSSANTASGVRLANKWAVFFVPFSVAFSLLTWLITGEVERAVAVIVAATPCPLILAVPVALISGMSRASSRGAIIKGGAALERLARAKTVMVDKTGTLTKGGPELSEVVVAPNQNQEEVLELVASLEQYSPHVVAKALVASAKTRGLTLHPATEVSEDHGKGLSGKVLGKHIQIGQPKLPLPSWAPSTHGLMVSVEIDNKLVAILGLDDPIREEAKSTIESLRSLGVDRIILVSGDRESTSKKVGEAVGVDEVFFNCSPEDKLKIVDRELLLANGSVVFAGDGINDAPALTRASAGVAMGAHGTTAASEAADVVIVEDSIKQLAVAIDIAKGARSRARQSAGFGMSLAMLAMVAASLGFLDATESALTQEFIDAAAILWALVPTRKRV